MSSKSLHQNSIIQTLKQEYESSTELLVLVDVNLSVIWANLAYLQKIRQELTQLISCSYLNNNLGKETDQKQISKLLSHKGSKGSLEIETWLYQCRDEMYFASIHLSSILNGEGELLAYIIKEKDITSDKLQEATQISSTTERISGLGSWEVDLETNTPIWSDEVKRIHEVPLDFEPDMDTAINFYTPEVRPLVSQYVVEAIEKKKPFEFVLPFITAKGRHIMVHSIGEPKVVDGKTIGLSGFFRDITEDYYSKQRLEELSERLQIATQTAGIGIWDWDIVNDELNWDENMYSLYGVNPNHFEGAYQAWSNGLHPEDREEAEKNINTAIETRTDFNTEFRIIWPNGVERSIRAFGKVKYDESGKPSRMIGTNWDITQEKQVLKELIKAREKAEAGMKAKIDFLSMMSHELRTPMNSVIGMANVMYTTKLNEDQKEYLKTLEKSANSMMNLLNDIIDYSRFESKSFKLDLKELDLTMLTEEIISTYQRKAKEKSLDFIVGIEQQVLNVLIDPTRYHQILGNILDNAIKFTEKGQVQIKMRVKQVYKNKVEISVEVQDTGIGIPTVYQEDVFKTFTQADTSSTRKFGGTGMGLAICKRLVEMMNGEITFKSKENIGTSFYFNIQLDTPK